MGTFMRWRAKSRRFPAEKIPNTFGNRSYWAPVVAVIKGVRSGNYNEVALPDTFKVSIAAALANGASTTVWTPAAGNVIQLTSLVISGSIAGAYDLTVNGVTVAEYVLAANQAFAVPIAAPGIFCYPAAAALALKNNSGGASNTDISVMGTEVIA